MGLSKYPNGVSSFGIPVLSSGGEIPVTTGDYYFVDSVTGNDNSPGTDPEEPLATIDAAVDKCTANKGDVILVMPNHAETIANATTLVPDVAGITIVGLGNGSNQPELTFNATGSTIDIGAANITMKNIRFVAGISAVVCGLDVNGNYFTLDGCTFTYSTTAFDFVIMVDVDGYDDCDIRDCNFEAEDATAGCEHGIRLDEAERLKIIGCFFKGDYSDSPITGEGAASTSIVIANNIIYNDDTGNADNGIHLGVACTGIIAHNVIGSLYALAIDAVIDPGSCLTIENYCCNAVDEYASILPGTDAST